MTTPIETAAEALVQNWHTDDAKEHARAALASLAQHRDDIARDTCPCDHAERGTVHAPHEDIDCQWSQQQTDAVLAYLTGEPS